MSETATRNEETGGAGTGDQMVRVRKGKPAPAGEEPDRGVSEEEAPYPVKYQEGISPMSSDLFLHSFFLLAGRAGSKVLDGYNSMFSLGERDMTRIYENLGRGFRKKGLYDKALAAYRELIRLNPRNPEYYFQMGRLYEVKRENDLAAEAYRAAISLRGDHAQALYRLGVVHGKRKELEKAIEAMSRAVELSEENDQWLYRLGVYYDKVGSSEKALEKLQRAVALNPEEPKYHQYLGFVYEGLGRHDEAVKHFKCVMELEHAADEEP